MEALSVALAAHPGRCHECSICAALLYFPEHPLGRAGNDPARYQGLFVEVIAHADSMIPISNP
jgi:hypothetical protein